MGVLLRAPPLTPAEQRRLRRLLSFYEPAGNVPESFIATPVYKADKLAGVLVFEISATTISAHVSSIRGLGQTGEALIVGPDGLMRTQSHFSTDPNVLVTPVHSDIVTKAIGGARASGTVSGYRGQQMVGLAAPFEIDGTKWAVVAVQAQDEVLAPVIAMRNAMLLVGGALLLIAAGLGLWFSRSVTKPISRLTGTMKALAEGDLEVEVKGSARHDEIGEMARTVEVFRENALKITSMTDEERRRIQERRRVERDHDDAGAAAGVRRSGRCGGQRRLQQKSGSRVPGPGAQCHCRQYQQSGRDCGSWAGGDRKSAVGAGPDRSDAPGRGRIFRAPSRSSRPIPMRWPKSSARSSGG